MYNQSEFLDASGSLDHEAIQAHFLRIGKLEGLRKGLVVYYDSGPYWVTCRLIRRLPGDVWLAKLDVPIGLVHKVCISVNTFGGVCAE
jgi:hypothetical protein